MLFEMLFTGYLFGIRSQRRLEQEINVNTASYEPDTKGGTEK